MKETTAKMEGGLINKMPAPAKSIKLYKNGDQHYVGRKFILNPAVFVLLLTRYGLHEVAIKTTIPRPLLPKWHYYFIVCSFEFYVSSTACLTARN